MTRVLLDANALMMPVELDVRVFDELDRLLGGPDDPPRPPEAPLEAPTQAESGAGQSAAVRTESDPTPSAVDTDVGAGAGPASDEDETADSGIGGVTLLVPTAVVRELEELSGSHGEEAVAASVGADLAGERCRILPHEASHADDAIVEIATDRRAVIEYVLTNDRALRERLHTQGVPVICLRGHDQLTITNP
jgi:rRNA-processing protein FCF1